MKNKRFFQLIVFVLFVVFGQIGVSGSLGSSVDNVSDGGDVIANLAPPFDAVTSVRDMGIYCGTSVYSGVSGQTVDSMDGVMCVFSSAGGVTTLGKYVGATSVVGLIGEEEASAITTGLKRIIKTTKETFGESFQMFKFLDELKLFKDLELLKFLKIEARIDPAIVEEIVKGVTKFEQITVQHRLQFNKLLEYFNSEYDLGILHAAVGNIDDYEDVAVGTEKVLGDFENLESFAPGVAKQAKAEALRDIGTVARDYGDDVAKSTMNGITREVIQVDKVSPKDLGDYITAVEKIPGAVDPIEDTGKQGLVKMMNSPSTRTLVKDDSGKIIKEIDNVAVLKNGEHYFDQVKQKWSGFGWLHIYLPRNQVQSHANDIMDALNLVDNDAAVKDVISEILETGEVNHIPGNAYEITKTVTRNGQSHDILVVISDDPKNIGSLQDAYPI